MKPKWYGQAKNNINGMGMNYVPNTLRSEIIKLTNQAKGDTEV
jgi:hypothetical protein